MQSQQSKQTRFLLVGLGLLACLGVWLVARMATSSRKPMAGDNPVAAHAAGSQVALTDDALRPTADALRDTRAAAAHEPLAPAAILAADAAGETIEIQVVQGSEEKPVASAEVMLLEFSKDQRREMQSWKWLSNGELDTHVEHDAVKATTDSDGKVRLKRTQYGAVVLARTTELWGYGDFGPDDEVPWRVKVVRDAAVSARVVDAREAPVAGARVCLRTRSGDWFWDLGSVETRADGSARLPHAGYLLSNQGGGRQTLTLALGAVLDREVEVELDPEKLPAEPVRLVVPSTGSCTVLVVGADGKPYVDEVEVSLRQATPNELAGINSPDPNDSAFALHDVRGGRAEFKHVSPGREFVAGVSRRGANTKHTARAPGPVAAGGNATITVRIGETVAIVRGVALDANRARLAKARFRVWVEQEKDQRDASDHNWEVESDDQGRFHADVSPRTPDDGAHSLVLVQVDDKGVETASATHTLPANLTAGVHELGDFVLQPVLEIVSGRVVDAANNPVSKATVQLFVKRTWGEEDDNFWWEPLWNQTAHTDAEGRFTVRGRVDSDTLSVTAEKSGSKAEAVPCARGATNLLLRMSGTGEIAGRILHSDALRKSDLQLSVDRTDARTASIEASLWSPTHIADDGSFVIRDLRPGMYTVTLRHTADWGDLQTVEDIRVDTGVTTRDPRLNPLDLRAGLAALTLTIVDTDGLPIRRGNLWVTKPNKNGEAQVSGAQIENGKAVLTHDGSGVDVTIICTGYRAVRLEKLREDRTVTLSPAPRVRLVMTGARVPDKPYWLGANLTQVEGEQNFPSWSDEESYFDAQGRVTLFAPAAGRLQVEFKLVLKDEHSWTSTTFQPKAATFIEVRDNAGEQTFEVACDAEALAKTLEELRKEN